MVIRVRHDRSEQHEQRNGQDVGAHDGAQLAEVVHGVEGDVPPRRGDARVAGRAVGLRATALPNATISECSGKVPERTRRELSMADLRGSNTTRGWYASGRVGPDALSSAEVLLKACLSTSHRRTAAAQSERCAMCGETSGKMAMSGDCCALKRQRVLLARSEKAAVWMHWERATELGRHALGCRSTERRFNTT